MTRKVLTSGAGNLPLRAAVRVDVSFTDGSSGTGSGYMVGLNDVLTASHVVYTLGKTVETITVYPEVISGSSGYGVFESVSVNFNEIGNGSAFITTNEIPYDYAIIGLGENIGYSTGWYGITSTYAVGEAVYGIDYGSDFNALQAIFTEGVIEKRILNVVTHSMEKVPGSSGSAIIRTSDNAIVGVHSANSSNGDFLAAGFDIGSFATVQGWIAGNNVISALIPQDGISRSRQLGTEEGTQTLWDQDTAVEIFGLAGNDTLMGGSGNDIIFGGDGDDTVMGGAGDDFLGGDNTFFTPYVGSDLIDGGDGIDTVLYLNNREIYELSWMDDGSIRVSGFDSLIDVERIQYADGTVRVDLDRTMGAQVYRLYQAMFNRNPDEDGLVYWAETVNGQVSIEEIASFFISSAEFTTLYGNNPSTGEFVTALYLNVLGRAPDSEGQAFWTEVLNQGTDRATVLIGFSESSENTLLTADAIANGFLIL